MNFPLARDQQGNPLNIPPEAAYWRVRRHTGGRPSTVLGPDGEPLYIGITRDRPDLQAYGCAGSIRLEAVDGDYKPVRAPVAFVEMGPAAGAPENPVAAAIESADSPQLVRSAIDSLTRTVEAMQRSQVEHERGFAVREKALSDGQIEMQRTHAQLISLLLDKVTGGKPKDSLTTLQEHTKFQKAVEALTGKPRNADLGPAPALAEDSNGDNGIAKWVGLLAPLLPTMVHSLVGGFANTIEDPEKAASLRRNGSAIASVIESLSGGLAKANPTLAFVGGSTPAANDPAGVYEGGEAARLPPRALREVLALLDDDSAGELSGYLDGLDDPEFQEVARRAQSFTSLEERMLWARGLIHTSAHSPASGGEPEASSLLAIPPAFVAVLGQLTEEERTYGGQLLQVLDRATLEQLKARLLAMPSDQAVTTLRGMIAHARRGAASVAQRAVRSGLHDPQGDGLSSGGVA